MNPVPDISHITLSKLGSSEYEIKKSVFIGNAMRVSSPLQAEEFVNSIRSKYPDARHVAYAWIVSTDTKMQKFSDDGEPAGTAGKPLISLLTSRGLSDCVVTVTRYFGGVLLGTGGLVHSYTKAAVDAIEDALPVVIERGVRYELDCTYAMSEKIVYLLSSLGAKITGTEYAYDVKVFFECKLMIEDNILYSITQLSSGKVIPIKLGECDIEGQRLEV